MDASNAFFFFLGLTISFFTYTALNITQVLKSAPLKPPEKEPLQMDRDGRFWYLLAHKFSPGRKLKN